MGIAEIAFIDDLKIKIGSPNDTASMASTLFAGQQVISGGVGVVNNELGTSTSTLGGTTIQGLLHAGLIREWGRGGSLYNVAYNMGSVAETGAADIVTYTPNGSFLFVGVSVGTCVGGGHSWSFYVSGEIIIAAGIYGPIHTVYNTSQQISINPPILIPSGVQIKARAAGAPTGGGSPFAAILGWNIERNG